MIKNKINDKKFIFEFQYNEENKTFLKANFLNKDLSELGEKILSEICKSLPSMSIEEIYQHLIIRIENRIRDYENYNYSGVVFTENMNEEFNYLKNFLRNLIKSLADNNFNKKINYQHIKPNINWIYLNDQEKINKINHILRQFESENKLIESCIELLRIENKNEIFISLEKITDIAIKPKILLNLEVTLKKKIDISLTVYLDSMTDKNKGRRIKI